MSQTPPDDVHSDSQVRTAAEVAGERVDGSASTGDPAIDRALQATGSLEDTDVAEHPAAFEHVHRVLRDALAGTAPSAEGHRDRP